MENTENTFVIKTYTRKELQFMYGIPEKTFRRWLAPFREEWGVKRFKYFSPEQVRKIIETYGYPKKSLAI